MMQKARTGTKAGVFRTAVDLLQRSWADMGAHDLDEFITRRTLAILELVADVVDTLSFNGVLPDRLKIVDGSLTSGPFAYRHPTSTAVTDRGLPPGIYVDGRPIDRITDVTTRA
jgi:hypothetical protein